MIAVPELPLVTRPDWLIVATVGSSDLQHELFSRAAPIADVANASAMVGERGIPREDPTRFVPRRATGGRRATCSR